MNFFKEIKRIAKIKNMEEIQKMVMFKRCSVFKGAVLLLGPKMAVSSPTLMTPLTPRNSWCECFGVESDFRTNISFSSGGTLYALRVSQLSIVIKNEKIRSDQCEINSILIKGHSLP